VEERDDDDDGDHDERDAGEVDADAVHVGLVVTAARIQVWLLVTLLLRR
jgi:hypothetical protein